MRDHLSLKAFSFLEGMRDDEPLQRMVYCGPVHEKQLTTCGVYAMICGQKSLMSVRYRCLFSLD